MSSSKNRIIKTHAMKTETVLVGQKGKVALSVEGLPVAEGPYPEELIRQAQDEANVILERAAAELQALREQAYREGYLAGSATGMVDAHSEMDPFLEKLAGLASQAQIDYTRMIKDAEDAVVGLALGVAEKLVYREISLDRSLVSAVVRQILESDVARVAMRLRLNPDDVEMVRRFWAEAYTPGSALASVEMAGDLRVGPGGCMVETATGVIDARVETRIAEITRAFTRLEQREDL